MFLKQLYIKAFKGIKDLEPPLIFGIPNGESGSGLNLFVGENNTGKSTIFEAIDFLRNNTKKSNEAILNRHCEEESAVVEVILCGDIENVIEEFCQENKKAVFKDSIYKSDEISQIKLQRITGAKNVIEFWNPESQSFKNITGIDGPFKNMFEANFVWADTNPNDQTSFGSTTICGNLLAEIVKGFQQTDDYEAFNNQFEKTFNDESSKLKKELKSIEDQTQKIFEDQFGQAKISFHFEALSPTSFFKNTKVFVDDGTSTLMEEKGSGMQRAVALAMIQVLADITSKHPDKEISKPLFLFIDEPEVCLHPKAQEKLFNALINLSKNNQVFISTHSPYFLTTPFLRNMSLFVCKKSDDSPKIQNISNSGIFPWSPTWGEINYRAYDMPSVEFHNELYGRIQDLKGKPSEREVETEFVALGVPKTKNWHREKNNQPNGQPYELTLQTFIRNKIHHPENSIMRESSYTPIELKESIDQMINLIDTHQEVQNDD